MQRRLPAVMVCLCVSLLAQNAVDRSNLYERIWAIVPLIGTGTADDPIRPAYIPAPPPSDSQRTDTPPSTDGIIGFTMQLTDDGKSAIVQFVARDRSAFKDILADKSVDVKVFEKGKAQKDDINQEFRKVKKDFDIDQMGVALP